MKTRLRNPPAVGAGQRRRGAREETGTRTGAAAIERIRLLAAADGAKMPRTTKVATGGEKTTGAGRDGGKTGVSVVGSDGGRRRIGAVVAGRGARGARGGSQARRVEQRARAEPVPAGRKKPRRWPVPPTAPTRPSGPPSPPRSPGGYLIPYFLYLGRYQQCCGAEIINFRLRLQLQLQSYIATENCSIIVIPY